MPQPRAGIGHDTTGIRVARAVREAVREVLNSVTLLQARLDAAQADIVRLRTDVDRLGSTGARSS